MSQVAGEGFKETPYIDASWEIVGPPPTNGSFEPMPVENLDSAQRKVDPMFDDFNTTAKNSTTRRWHLAEGQDGDVGSTSRAEAPKIVGVPEEEVARRVAEARTAGHAAGLAEGRAEVAAGQAALESRISTLIKDIGSQLQQSTTALEAVALEIAVAIAQKITFATAELNPEYILPIIREGLRLTQGARIHKVRVSPQDLEFVELEGVAKTLSEFDGSWSFVADESVRAGCIVETSAGEVDLNLDAAWERVAQQVLRSARS